MSRSLSHTLSHTLLSASLALALAGLATAAFGAEQPVTKAKAAAKARPHPKAQPEETVDEPDADVSDTTTTEYLCDLGTRITLFRNDNDSEHIALRWKKHIHRLERIGTTTGAQRFENRRYGLIWIGIPSKSMLLDSKLNRQLANECKNTEQAKPAVVETPEAKKS